MECDQKGDKKGSRSEGQAEGNELQGRRERKL